MVSLNRTNKSNGSHGHPTVVLAAPSYVAKIDRNIPIPAEARGRPNRYPFNQMNVGDSFAFPADIKTATAHAAARHHSRAGMRFIARKQPGGGYRCWRTA